METKKNKILGHIIAAGGLTAAYVFMLALSWRKWPDALIDYGQELYVPWQISQGGVMTKDVNFVLGPLAWHINAVLFKIFAPGLMVLAWFNIILTAVLIGVIYYLFYRMFGRASAFAAALGFIFIFACNQFVGIGNYNYICPYTYNSTYGLFFSFVCLLMIFNFIGTSNRKWLLSAAICFGLVFLTKVEIFTALMCAMITCLIIIWRREAILWNIIRKNIYSIIILGCIPGIIFFIYLTVRGGFNVGFKYLFCQYLVIFMDKISTNVFYQQVFGTNDLRNNIGRMISTFDGYLICAGALIGIAWIYSRVNKIIGWSVVLIIGLFFIIFGSMWLSKPLWFDIGRPFPLISLIIIGWAIWKIRRAADKRIYMVLVFAVFSLGMLAKMAFNSHVFHYGFVLAMPAGILIATFLVDELPKIISNRWGAKLQIQTISWCLFSVMLISSIIWSQRILQLKTVPIGFGRDMFYDYSPKVWNRGIVMADFVSYLQKEIKPNQTMVTFPEGVIFNYLCRVKNPILYFGSSPITIKWLGENTIIEDLKNTHPDYIILAHRDSLEHGARFFGKDFGLKIMEWIRQNYAQVAIAGEQPFVNDKFGVILMKRKN